MSDSECTSVCSEDPNLPGTWSGIQKMAQARMEEACGDKSAESAFCRDHWLGLAEIGMRYEEAKQFVRNMSPNPRECKGGFVQCSDLAFLKTTQDRYDCDRWWALQPDNDEKNGFDAAVANGRVPQAVRLVTLMLEDVEDDIDNAVSIAYTGSKHYIRYFCELMLDKYWNSVAKMHLKVGRHTLDFKIDFDKAKATSMVVNRFMSAMLSTVFWSGRPLRNYSAIFFVPIPKPHDSESYALLDGLDRKEYSSGISTTGSGVKLAGPYGHMEYRKYDPEEIDAQVINYFSPMVRKQLFHIVQEGISEDDGNAFETDSDIKPISEYELEVDDEMELVQCNDNLRTTAVLHKVSLYRHNLGQDILSFHVAMNLDSESECSWQDAERADGVTWWHDVFSPDKEAFRFQFESWLNLTRLFRVIYPSFIEQWEEEKISGMTCGSECYPFFEGRFGQVNGLIEHYLGKFYLDSDAKRALDAIRKNSRDDRMFVSVAYCLAGEPPGNRHAVSEYERLFQIALHVDRQMDAGPESPVYSPSFNNERSREQVYDRWQHLGTYYGQTDHSMVCSGFGRFTREKIVALDMPYLYSRLSLINLMYKYLFHYFEYKISEFTPGEDRASIQNDSRLNSLRTRFMIFTNRYWFHDVTEQQQGKDLYRMQSRQFRLSELHDEVQNEVEKTHEYDLARWRDHLSGFGVFAGFVSLFASIWSSNYLKDLFSGYYMAWFTKDMVSPGIYKQTEHFVGASFALIISTVIIGSLAFFLGARLYPERVRDTVASLFPLLLLSAIIPIAGGFFENIVIYYRPDSWLDYRMIVSLIVLGVCLVSAMLLSMVCSESISNWIMVVIGIAVYFFIIRFVVNTINMLNASPVAVEKPALFLFSIIYAVFYLWVGYKVVNSLKPWFVRHAPETKG